MNLERAVLLVRVAEIQADRAQADLQRLLRRKSYWKQQLKGLRCQVMTVRANAAASLQDGNTEEWSLLLSQVAVCESSQQRLREQLAELEPDLGAAETAMREAQKKLEQMRFLQKETERALLTEAKVLEQKAADEWFLIKQRMHK